jgi:hypothetical protein
VGLHLPFLHDAAVDHELVPPSNTRCFLHDGDPLLVADRPARAAPPPATQRRLQIL